MLVTIARPRSVYRRLAMQHTCDMFMMRVMLRILAVSRRVLGAQRVDPHFISLSSRLTFQPTYVYSVGHWKTASLTEVIETRCTH